MFKLLFRVFLALSFIALVLAVIRYFEVQRSDYIQIYNDDMNGELFE